MHPSRWGDEWGGADEATRVWFRRTKRRLEAGRERAASRGLGIMSHFIADVANPMHTDSSDKEDGVHSSYESAVDGRIPNYPFRPRCHAACLQESCLGARGVAKGLLSRRRGQSIQ